MKLFPFLLMLSAAPGYAAAIASYSVSIDTRSLAPATNGFIDLTFNGGYPATAVIDNFMNVGGSLNPGTIFTQGTVTGSLPGMLTMKADNADYDEGIGFGSAIKFNLTLSGTPGGTTGDVFTLSFFNSGFTGGLLTGNANDLWIAQFKLDTRGNVTSTAYANPAGGPSFATIASVPEPATGMLFLVGLLGAALYRQRASVTANRRAR